MRTLVFNNPPSPPVLTFDDPEQDMFENIVGKGEKVGNQHFVLSLQCFLLFPDKF